MGTYPIGDYEVPGLRESFYGKFAVNLGVVLPCVSLLEKGLEARAFYQEYHCHIRTRLGSEEKQGTELWWDLDSSTESVSEDVLSLLPGSERFFSNFTAYEQTLGYFEAHGKFPFSNPGRSQLVAALVSHHLGHADKARLLFRRAGQSEHRGFREHVQRVAAACGHDA